MGQQILHRLGNLVQAQGADLRGAWPGKNQQLTHQVRSLHNRRTNLFGIATPAVACIQSCQQQVAIQQHSSQEVVEVMYHAPRQAAYSFPSLRLKQTLLDGANFVIRVTHEQRMHNFLSVSGKTPACPSLWSHPSFTARCLHTNAVARRIQQLAKKRFGCAAVFRRH